MKILRIMTRLNIGGPAVHASILSTQLDPARFSTCLVVGEPDRVEGDLTDLLEGTRARVVRLSALRRRIDPWADARAWCWLVRITAAERPDIIHTHMAKAGALGRLAGLWYNRIGPGRRPGARAVLIHTFHGHVLDGYFSAWAARLFLAVERWLARRTDRLIAVSQAVRDALLAKGVGRPDQWRVIPLGLDLSALAGLPLPNGQSPVRVGMVGRLVPIKNPGLFLEALRRTVRREPALPMSGVIVGDGPLRGQLEREAKALGLDRIVRFTGWQRDLCAVYGGLEVGCLTSWNEGTPVSLIEAMAAGRPVIATDVGGVRDLLADGDGPGDAIAPGTFRVAARGLLVRPGDAEGVAAALERLARDATLCRQLGTAARAYVIRHYAQERLIADLTACYEGVQPGRA